MSTRVETFDELDGVVSAMVDRILSAETTVECDRAAISSVCAVVAMRSHTPERHLPDGEILRLAARITTAAEQRTRQLAGAALREAAPWLLTAHPQTPAVAAVATARDAAVEGPPDRAGADGPPARPAALHVVRTPDPTSREEQP